MESLTHLLRDLCQCVGLPDPETVIARRMVQVRGMEVGFEVFDDAPDHFQIHFRFGAIAAGRALRVFSLMLEANLLVYAKDNAHFALDPDTAESLLLMRVAFSESTTGKWLADTLMHYAEHCKYWKNNILSCEDEQFNGVASGEYQWLRV